MSHGPYISGPSDHRPTYGRRNRNVRNPSNEVINDESHSGRRYQRKANANPTEEDDLDADPTEYIDINVSLEDELALDVNLEGKHHTDIHPGGECNANI